MKKTIALLGGVVDCINKEECLSNDWLPTKDALNALTTASKTITNVLLTSIRPLIANEM